MYIQVHLGYNDVIVSTKSNRYMQVIAYPERFTEGTGIIDSMKSNRTKEDIVARSIITHRVAYRHKT